MPLRSEMPDARLEIADTLGRRVVRLQKSVVRIGRRSECDLKVAGSDVSRDHAEIVCQRDGYLVRDRQSRYGTFVNDAPVTEQLLQHRDRIRLGRAGGAELVFLTDATGSTIGAGPAGASAVDALHQMTTLLEGLRAIGSGYVLDDVLALVLDAAVEVTGAERGFILLANAAGQLELMLARGRGRVTLGSTTLDRSHKIPEVVFATGESRIATDLLDSMTATDHVGTVALGIRHVLCAPLTRVRYVAREDIAPEPQQLGVLYLDSRERATLLSPTARTGLDTLAREAAVAIENARLYRELLEKARVDQELKIAADIQQGLLPDARYVGPGVEIVGASIPCRSIGGDFFDNVELPSGGFGFALGDVAGKGPPAALLTAAIQGMFAALATVEVRPCVTVAQVNQALIRRAVQNRFVTMFYGVLARDGRLTTCNAGHNPPFLCSRGRTRRLTAGGMVLGMFPQTTYEEETVSMAPGDVLVVFSDGVSEAIDRAGAEFGDERIAACLSSSLDQTPGAMLDALLGEVRQFSMGCEQRDDITALVMRYTGLGATGAKA